MKAGDLSYPCSRAQVWNVTAHGGVVAAFNVQGASWSRTKRAFHTHDASPPALEAVVRPQDVDSFMHLQEVQRFALYSDRLQRFEVTAAHTPLLACQDQAVLAT